MVYTERAEMAAVSYGTSDVTSVDIQKRAIKKQVTQNDSCRIKMRAQRVCPRAEIKAVNNKNKTQTRTHARTHARIHTHTHLKKKQKKTKKQKTIIFFYYPFSREIVRVNSLPVKSCRQQFTPEDFFSLSS